MAGRAQKIVSGEVLSGVEGQGGANDVVKHFPTKFQGFYKYILFLDLALDKVMLQKYIARKK